MIMGKQCPTVYPNHSICSEFRCKLDFEAYPYKMLSDSLQKFACLPSLIMSWCQSTPQWICRFGRRHGWAASDAPGVAASASGGTAGRTMMIIPQALIWIMGRFNIKSYIDHLQHLLRFRITAFLEKNRISRFLKRFKYVNGCFDLRMDDIIFIVPSIAFYFRDSPFHSQY